MGGVEWSEPLLHSTLYQLEWSGVEWGLAPWTPWSGSKRGTQMVSVLEVYRQGKPYNSVNMNSLFVFYVSVPSSYKDLR
jgi:hypothetical protein